MFEWLAKNGWEELSGHEEGRIFLRGELYASVYFGDGYWHLFRRVEGSQYDWNAVAATGVGIAALQQALVRLESPADAHSQQPHASTRS